MHNPAKKVNKPITPFTSIAVKMIIMLEPVILKNCFNVIGKLLRNVENAFESFAISEPVKWENRVSCVAWMSNEKNDNNARPEIAIRTESAINIYAIINSMFTIKNGSENIRDVSPNFIDFQKLDR